MTERPTLLSEVRTILGLAERLYQGSPHAPVVKAVQARLDEPLRVAIAGKVKAGKSTLLNALVGEELAPTDAGECTRIVTWYRDGITYRVTAFPHDEDPRQVPFHRSGGAIDVDLGDLSAAAVDRLEVEWPSASLRALTLIDTPGIGSLSTHVSARTLSFLTPGEDQVTPADAVLYLMRHLHSTDLDFLETFHDDEVAQATPVNSVAVMSRADEVGVGRLDSMTSAARIAERYRSDPKIRRLCQTVVPVAGLLAQAGTTLREAEFRALQSMANAEPGDVDRLFLSADRFSQAPTSVSLTSMEREHLLDRLGLYGVRLSVSLMRDGQANTSTQLADLLVRYSGLVELRHVLVTQFAARRDTLKARSALLAVEALLHDAPPGDGGQLAAELERVTAGAHELTELRLLNGLRAGTAGLRGEEILEAERLLGAVGPRAVQRLGLPDEAGEADVRNALDRAIARWQRRAENPLSSRDAVDASRVLIRTCEGLLANIGR
jgi:hypothetical protein